MNADQMQVRESELCCSRNNTHTVAALSMTWKLGSDPGTVMMERLEALAPQSIVLFMWLVLR